SANQTLDLRAAAIESDFGNVARLSRLRRVWEHRVFGGKAAARYALLFHPSGNVFLDGNAANHTRITHGNKQRAACMRRDIQLETDRANFIRPAAMREIT